MIEHTVAYLDIETQENTQYFDVFFNFADELIDIFLCEEKQLDVELSMSSQTIDIFMENSANLDVEMLGGGEGRYPYYAGAYIVNPRKVEQTLPTKNRSLTDDVVVRPIFYAETSNLSGGLTAVIGLE